MSNPWIDISVPLRPGLPHWPGEPAFEIERVKDLERGDAATVSRMRLSVHTGTHVDAPSHFLRGGTTVDAIALDRMLGPCRVVRIEDGECVRRAELVEHGIEAGERILLRTRNSDRAWHAGPFDENFVFVEADAARHLVERGVRTVGVDYLSVGGFHRDGKATHDILLGAEIFVIEGLDLSRVAPGRYELACLPLLIQNADGAPARAALRPLDESA